MKSEFESELLEKLENLTEEIRLLNDKLDKGIAIKR